MSRQNGKEGLLTKTVSHATLPGAKWVYGTTIFLSAFLLFQVQPILAKLILPWFGGAAAVWTISLAFYQLTYLLGNLYAHFLMRQRGVRLSARLHAVVLLGSLLLLARNERGFVQLAELPLAEAHDEGKPPKPASNSAKVSSMPRAAASRVLKSSRRKAPRRCRSSTTTARV